MVKKFKEDKIMARKNEIKQAVQNFFNDEAETEVTQPAEEKKLEIKQPIDPAPEGFKINPAYIEVKSQRVQFVFQPSLLKLAKAEAKRRKTSLNELVHIALREFLEKQK